MHHPQRRMVSHWRIHDIVCNYHLLTNPAGFYPRLNPNPTRTNMKKTTTMNQKQFANEHGIRTDRGIGFKTADMANQFAAIKRAAWGDNLVYLGAEEENGIFYPEFNLFD